MPEHHLDPPLEMDSLPLDPPATGKSFESHKHSRRDYAIGIGLLLLVVFLWTASNFVTQVRLQNKTANGPVQLCFLSGLICWGVWEALPVCTVLSLLTVLIRLPLSRGAESRTSQRAPFRCTFCHF